MSDYNRALPLIESALARHNPPRWTAEHVLHAVSREEAQMWLGNGSVVVTEIAEFPTGVRVLQVWLAAGDLDEIRQHRFRIESWAQMAGCTEVEFDGRLGWDRVLTDYRRTGITLRKALV